MNMDVEQKVKLLDEFVECYRAKRIAHIQSKWFTYSAMWARLLGKAHVFDTLRNSDVVFFHRMHGMLHMHLNSRELGKDDIGELALYLKGHRSILSERDFFLVIYVAIISSTLLIPKDNGMYSASVFLTVLFCLVLLW